MTAADWYTRYRVILYAVVGLLVVFMVAALILYALKVAAGIVVARIKRKVDR